MKRGVCAAVVAAAVLMGGALAARADDWKGVGEQTAGGEAKELSVDREITKIRIECVEGSVIVNTVVVRKGGQKDPHKLATRIEKGDSREITLESKTKVTGLRISDDGRGRYKVSVR
jgi:hypothetical protein